jgi:microbial collagenase
MSVNLQQHRDSLVSLIKSSDINCINDLFSVSGSQANAIFKESQMVTVANAFRNAASSYNGTNSSIAQMVLFLRAGYYVQFYDKAVGNYGPIWSAPFRVRWILC